MPTDSMIAPPRRPLRFDHLPPDPPPPDEDPPPGNDRPRDDDPLHPPPDEACRFAAGMRSHRDRHRQLGWSERAGRVGPCTAGAP